MRRIGWLSLGLALASSAAPVTSHGAETPKVEAFGNGSGYEALGRLAVLHNGRPKPLDTVARQEIKLIFGRETIKLYNDEHEVVATWTPTAALLDWSVRPTYWDDQPIILVQFLPLKRLILADAIRARLGSASDKPETSPADKAALKTLADDKALTAVALNAFLAKSSLPKGDSDRQGIADLARQLSEEHKWCTPRQLEEARVTVGATSQPFESWVQELARKQGSVEASISAEGMLNDLEENATEVFGRLRRYENLRDRDPQSREPMAIVPRPHNKVYLTYTGETLKKVRQQGQSGMTPLQLEALMGLRTYWDSVPNENRLDPGTDPKADAAFTEWLTNRSGWIPLKLLLDSKPDELESAGFDKDKAATFARSFNELTAAEEANPGALPLEKAKAFVTASRDLAEEQHGYGYPTVADIDRETYFNRTNPFWTAPIAYGIGTIFLALHLGFLGFNRGTVAAKLGGLIYTVGLLGLAGGIGLEAQGFYYRVRISGWAPVTNMYETVIWVSLVAAVIGLVMEMIYRKTFTALAGAGLALPGTLLAANVSLLDANIKSIPPVLQSNYWLTIHVLTEVSSYGAFLLAASLGVIGTLYYLTATYRRSPSVAELPLISLIGAPVLGVGVVGLLASYGHFGSQWVTGGVGFYLALALAIIGGPLTLAGPIALIGEAISRLTFRDEPSTTSEPTNNPYQPATPTAKPTVAEIRAMAATHRVQLDARGRSMQETAARIKPISNFIYRTMQVGVLLIAAGTFLGGWWADKSWGRFWGWDAKEVWALITLVVYLIPLHGRFAGWFNTFTLVASSVVCSMSVIMAWYGVNFVLGVGLHAYGFTKGGGQGVVFSTCLAIVALPVAAGWRRYLGSRAATTATAEIRLNRHDAVAVGS